MMKADLLRDLMLQYALQGLYDWTENTNRNIQQRARVCLSQKISLSDGDIRHKIVIPNPDVFFPMPKVGYRSGIEQCLFMPRSHGCGDLGSWSWSFILFILLADNNSLAFRFEPAQMAGQRHNYAHMQFCRKIIGIDHILGDIPSWIPCRDPAFPLPSSNPVKLFLSMATSVHGREGGVNNVIVDIFQKAGKTAKLKIYEKHLHELLDERIIVE